MRIFAGKPLMISGVHVSLLMRVLTRFLRTDTLISVSSREYTIN